MSVMSVARPAFSSAAGHYSSSAIDIRSLGLTDDQLAGRRPPSELYHFPPGSSTGALKSSRGVSKSSNAISNALSQLSAVSSLKDSMQFEGARSAINNVYSSFFGDRPKPDCLKQKYHLDCEGDQSGWGDEATRAQYEAVASDIVSGIGSCAQNALFKEQFRLAVDDALSEVFTEAEAYFDSQTSSQGSNFFTASSQPQSSSSNEPTPREQARIQDHHSTSTGHEFVEIYPSRSRDSNRFQHIQLSNTGPTQSGTQTPARATSTSSFSNMGPPRIFASFTGDTGRTEHLGIVSRGADAGYSESSFADPEHEGRFVDLVWVTETEAGQTSKVWRGNGFE